MRRDAAVVPEWRRHVQATPFAEETAGRLERLGALTVEGPAIIEAAVVANELPNMPHLDLEQLGGFALAKAKEAVLAVTGG